MTLSARVSSTSGVIHLTQQLEHTHTQRCLSSGTFFSQPLSLTHLTATPTEEFVEIQKQTFSLSFHIKEF